MPQKISLYELIIEQINITHKSINQIEHELGYPMNTIKNFQNGTAPSTKELLEISSYFKIPFDILLSTTEEITSSFINHVFFSLNDNQKLELLKITQDWAVSQLNPSN